MGITKAHFDWRAKKLNIMILSPNLTTPPGEGMFEGSWPKNRSSTPNTSSAWHREGDWFHAMHVHARCLRRRRCCGWRFVTTRSMKLCLKPTCPHEPYRNGATISEKKMFRSRTVDATIIIVWWFGTFFVFLYMGNNHPIWLKFFHGVETTNQIAICMQGWNRRIRAQINPVPWNHWTVRR